MGGLVSLFAVTAFAADCKVNDPDISDEYVGGCVNGLAHGKGKAKGRDTYEGEFERGHIHGKGSYVAESGTSYNGYWVKGEKQGRGLQIYPKGSKYEGEWLNSLWHGFGKATLTNIDSDEIKSYGDRGKLVGDKFILEGIFENQSLILPCTSPQNCKQEQAKREAQERREAADRRREAADRERDRATACNKYYNGYVGYVDYNNGKRDFWGQDIGNKYGRFVVLGSGGGSVSIKGVDGGSYPGYDKMDNVSCTWLREKER